jgi:hypothetical protein
MSLKRWLPLLGALGLMLMVVGVAAGQTANSKPRKAKAIEKVCFWVESKGDRSTRSDIKLQRLNKTDRKFCLVAKSGAKGTKGSVGARGVPGPVGPNGAAGAQGVQGIQGIQGIQGERGFMGLQGIQGVIGLDGPPGADGQNGADGAEGPQGPQGLAGANGQNGADGAEGPQGPQGLAGANGQNGADGADGQDGAEGPRGPQGPQGPIGPQGPAGLDGNSIITVAGGTASGEKQFTVSCPANHVALSGGFDIQGSVTASFRSNAAGDPSGANSWTIVQSSGAQLSGTVYVYCVPVSAP